MVLAVLFFSLAVQTSGFTQSRQPSMLRAAAVSFALQNGLEVPRREVVVAVETRIAGGRFEMSKTSSFEQLEREAQEIAKLLGPEARTGRAQEYLQCPQNRCYAATNMTVVVVGAPATGSDIRRVIDAEASIYISVYSPAKPGGRATLDQAIVETSQTSAGWTGTRFSLEPTRIIVR